MANKNKHKQPNQGPQKGPKLEAHGVVQESTGIPFVLLEVGGLDEPVTLSMQEAANTSLGIMFQASSAQQEAYFLGYLVSKGTIHARTHVEALQVMSDFVQWRKRAFEYAIGQANKAHTNGKAHDEPMQAEPEKPPIAEKIRVPSCTYCFGQNMHTLVGFDTDEEPIYVCPEGPHEEGA